MLWLGALFRILDEALGQLSPVASGLRMVRGAEARSLIEARSPRESRDEGERRLWSEGPLGRRQAYAALAAVAAATVETAGCARVGKRAAVPHSIGGSVVLRLSPWPGFPGATSASGVALMYGATEVFRKKHKGVEIKIEFAGQQEALINAILSGNGPDVFADYMEQMFTDSNLLLDLAPFIKADNIDLSVWSAGQVALQNALGKTSPNGHGFYALPAYVNTIALAVDEALLDALGHAYPHPDWTYAEWTRLWEATTIRGTEPFAYAAPFAPNTTTSRPGVCLQWATGYSYLLPMTSMLHAWGGAYVDPSNPRKAGVASDASLSFFKWLVPLIQHGVVRPGVDFSPDLVQGRIASTMVGSYNTLALAQSWRGGKWDIFPIPVGPAGQVAQVYFDFYGVNAATKQPELSWELCKYLCYESQWSRVLMRIAGRAPGLKTLWGEWVHVLRSVAPVLQHKNLEVFVDQATGKGGIETWCTGIFEVNTPYAQQLIGLRLQQAIASKGIGLVSAMREAARQVDVYEAQAAATTLTPLTAKQQIAAKIAAKRRARARLQAMFGP